MEKWRRESEDEEEGERGIGEEDARKERGGKERRGEKSSQPVLAVGWLCPWVFPYENAQVKREKKEHSTLLVTAHPRREERATRFDG